MLYALAVDLFCVDADDPEQKSAVCLLADRNMPQRVLEDQQGNRCRVGLTLLKDDQDLLDTLPEIVQLLDMEVDQSELEIEQLKAQCLEQGIIDEDDNYIHDGGEVSNDSYSSTDYTARPVLEPEAGAGV
ncbi:hypothetical protein VE03_10426 [Pseudogymnoascus sp. 23342-1-I1]|nr:hypothetical protein VE03_10426 [Pseudogymnoascus sp. 23342-1-I1]